MTMEKLEMYSTIHIGTRMAEVQYTVHTVNRKNRAVIYLEYYRTIHCTPKVQKYITQKDQNFDSSLANYKIALISGSEPFFM